MNYYNVYYFNIWQSNIIPTSDNNIIVLFQ